MNESIDWGQRAKNILKLESDTKASLDSGIECVFLRWGKGIYNAGLKPVLPEYSKDIVLVTKTEHSLPNELKGEIIKLDPKRLEFMIDESIDVSGREYMLKKQGINLVQLNKEESEYVAKHGAYKKYFY